MTTQDKRRLYEQIMRDVAKVVKRRILEYENDDNTSTLIKVMRWLDDVDRRTRQMMSEEELTEALEPDFDTNVSTLLGELQQWFTSDKRTYVIPRHNEIVKNVEFFLTPENIRLSDIVVYDPNREFVHIIDEFMAKRDYKMITYRIERDETEDYELVHLVYSPNELVSVNLKDVTSEYIYHITPSKNVSYIKQNGLRLNSRHGDAGIHYSNRLYFFTDEQTADNYRFALMEEYRIDDLTKLAIPVENVADMQFYVDPLLMNSHSIFTESPVVNVTGMKTTTYEPIDFMHPEMDADDLKLLASYLEEQRL